MMRPSFDMLVRDSKCADCSALLARGSLVWMRPLHEERRSPCTVVCGTCAAAVLLPQYDADFKARQDGLRQYLEEEVPS